MTIRSVITLMEAQRLWKHRSWDKELFWLSGRRHDINIASLKSISGTVTHYISWNSSRKRTYTNGRNLRYKMEITLDTTMFSSQSEISWIKERFFSADDIITQCMGHLVQYPTHYYNAFVINGYSASAWKFPGIMRS